MPLNRHGFPFSENKYHPKKRNVQPGVALEDTTIKPGFEIVKF